MKTTFLASYVSVLLVRHRHGEHEPFPRRSVVEPGRAAPRVRGPAAQLSDGRLRQLRGALLRLRLPRRPRARAHARCARRAAHADHARLRAALLALRDFITPARAHTLTSHARSAPSASERLSARLLISPFVSTSIIFLTLF